MQGLIAQRKTIAETLEIARDLAKKLLEAQENGYVEKSLIGLSDSFNYPLVVGL